MARRPSPSHLRRDQEYSNRLHDRNESLTRNREAFFGSAETTPAESLSRWDFYRAAEALRRANAPIRHVISDHPVHVEWAAAVRSAFQPKEEPVAKKPVRTDRFIESHPVKDGWTYSKPELVLNRRVQCCGVKEIHGIQHRHGLFQIGPEGFTTASYTELVQPFEVISFVRDMYYTELNTRARPFLFFTDNHLGYEKKEPRAGQALLEYIVENKLGQVFRTGKHLNENSGARIEMFTWVVDWPQLLKFKPTDPRVKTAAAAAT